MCMVKSAHGENKKSAPKGAFFVGYDAFNISP